MGSSPPHSAPKTVAMDHPTAHPPPRGHRPDEHPSNFPHSPYPPQSHAPFSTPLPRCRKPDEQWPNACALCAVLIVAGICFIVVLVFAMLLVNQITPDYPIVKVVGLTMSNLTVSASRVIWKAVLLVEKAEIHGKFSFSDVECFVYYHWDTAQPLAVALAKSFVLQAAANRIVIKVNMTMERPEVAVVEDMDRERRSVGTVAVGLGLSMRGTYVYGSWYKQSHSRIKALCDNLRVAFANSTAEGSLVTDNNLRSGDDLANNLPPCYIMSPL